MSTMTVQDYRMNKIASSEFEEWKDNDDSFNAPINGVYMITPEDMGLTNDEFDTQPDDAIAIVNNGSKNTYRIPRHHVGLPTVRTYVKVIATKYYGMNSHIREDIVAVYRDRTFVGFAFSHIDEDVEYMENVDFYIKYFYGYDYDADESNILMTEKFAVHEMARYISKNAGVSIKSVERYIINNDIMNNIRNK